ncbi:MAG: DUF935 family protein, partial [Rhizobiales bacterium]|nr:DUF935 family protein [Hyphomicrobiales bacterium]
PWVFLEYGPQKAYPKLRIGRTEERDVKNVIAGVTSLVPFGLRVAKTDMNELLGVPVPDDDAEVLQAPADAAVPEFKPDDTDKSEQALQSADAEIKKDDIDALAQVTDELLGSASDRIINQIRELVETSDTMEDVRDGLLGLFPNLDPEDFADQMRLALTYLELSGRDEADSPNA